MAQVLERDVGVVAGHVFEHFDAGDEVEAAVERVGERPDPASVGDFRRHLADRVLGDVDAPGVDAAGMECLDEHAHRATCVEDRRRAQLGDDALGDATEEPEPVIVALVRDAAVVAVVVLAEGDLHGALQRRRRGAGSFDAVATGHRADATGRRPRPG